MTRRKIGFLCVVATLIALTAWLGVATPRQDSLPSFAADDTDPYYIDSEATFEYFVNSCVSMIETVDPDNPEVVTGRFYPYEGRTKYFVSEVNPRFGGGYPHAYECGCDFMQLIKNNLEGKENKPNIGDYDDDVYMMKYLDVMIKRGGEMK